MNKNKLFKLAICVAALAVTGVIAAVTGSFQSLMNLRINITPQSVLNAIFSVLALIIVEGIISLILSAIKPKDHRARTVLTITGSLLKYIFGLIAICAVLAIFGADVQTVVAGVGVLALVIGFGAESLIEDAITGLFILFENQYNVGDIIEVDNFRGTVSSIGIRTTCLTDPGGNVLIINNSNMKNVLNRSDNKSRATCVFPIPYETDLVKLEEKLPTLLEAIYEANRDIMLAVPVYLGVDALADSSVNLKFVVEVDEKNIYSGIRVLNHDLYIGMKRLGVEVPFPQMDLHSK